MKSLRPPETSRTEVNAPPVAHTDIAGQRRRPRRDAVAVLPSGPGRRGGLFARDADVDDLVAETVFVIEIDGKSEVQTPAERIDYHLKKRLKELANPRGLFVCKLLEDVRRIKQELLNDGDDEAEVLAKKLTAMGYSVVNPPPLSPDSAEVKDASADCRRPRGQSWHPLTGSHGCLAVRPSSAEDGPGGRYLVEPYFRAQFVIQSPTNRYSEVLRLVPEEYVGPFDRLAELVKVVCREMADAFARTGRPLPPWRNCDRVVSKWDDLASPAEKDPVFNPVAPQLAPIDSPLDFKRLGPEEVTKSYEDRQRRRKSVLTDVLRYRVAYANAVRAGRVGSSSGGGGVGHFQSAANGARAVDRAANSMAGAPEGGTRLAVDRSQIGIGWQVGLANRGTVVSRYEQGWFGLGTMPPGVPNLGAVVH